MLYTDYGLVLFSNEEAMIPWNRTVKEMLESESSSMQRVKCHNITACQIDWNIEKNHINHDFISAFFCVWNPMECEGTTKEWEVKDEDMDVTIKDFVLPKLHKLCKAQKVLILHTVADIIGAEIGL